MRKNKRKRPDDGPDWPDWVKVVHAMFGEGPACEKSICVAVRAVRQAERLVRVVTPQESAQTVRDHLRSGEGPSTLSRAYCPGRSALRYLSLEQQLRWE